MWLQERISRAHVFWKEMDYVLKTTVTFLGWIVNKNWGLGGTLHDHSMSAWSFTLHVIFVKYEEFGYGHVLDLLAISYEFHVSYPRRSGLVGGEVNIWNPSTLRVCLHVVNRYTSKFLNDMDYVVKTMLLFLGWIVNIMEEGVHLMTIQWAREPLLC
jgi:hypothetical protein